MAKRSGFAFSATDLALEPGFHRLERRHQCGVTMNKQVLLAVALTLGMLPAALAQPPQTNSQEEQAACMDDAFKFCGDAIPDRTRVFNCLAANRRAISPR